VILDRSCFRNQNLAKKRKLKKIDGAIANLPKKINAANLPGRCKENQRCHRKFTM